MVCSKKASGIFQYSRPVAEAESDLVCGQLKPKKAKLALFLKQLPAAGSIHSVPKMLPGNRGLGTAKGLVRLWVGHVLCEPHFTNL